MERKEKMKKKKSTLRLFLVMISVCLLLPVAMAACSSDEDNNIPAENEISLANRKIPYQPMDVSSMPSWLAKQVGEYRESGMYVISGTWNGQPIYNVYVTFMSSFAGMSYDKDGEIMKGGVEYFYEVEDWTCIYFSKIGGEIL